MLRLLGFAPVCDPFPWHIVQPRIVPALGFASCRVGGHDSPCIRTGSTLFAITSLRKSSAASAVESFLSAHGPLGAFFHQDMLDRLIADQ